MEMATLDEVKPTPQYVTVDDLDRVVERMLTALNAEKTDRHLAMDAMKADFEQRYNQQMAKFDAKLDSITNTLQSLSNALVISQVETKAQIGAIRDTQSARNELVANLADEVEATQDDITHLQATINRTDGRVKGLEGAIYGDSEKPDSDSLLKLFKDMGHKMDAQTERTARVLVEVSTLKEDVGILKQNQRDQNKAWTQLFGTLLNTWRLSTPLQRWLLIGGATLVGIVYSYLHALV